MSLTIYRNNVGGGDARILRSTMQLLRCFLFFDVCWVISGISLIVMAFSHQLGHSKERLIMLGGIIGVYASTSALVNSLANFGVKTWRRSFLIPWLSFFLVVFCLIITHLADSLYEESFQWRQIFLFMAAIAVFSCWRHMLRQYNIMLKPRPQVSLKYKCMIANVKKKQLFQEQLIADVESMVRDLVNSSDQDNQPPKYEDLQAEEVPPPQYESCVLQIRNDERNS